MSYKKRKDKMSKGQAKGNEDDGRSGGVGRGA
jgi:hypothetical protein